LGGGRLKSPSGYLAALLLIVTLGACDDGSTDHFDARDSAALFAWVKKHQNDLYTYSDGVLSINQRTTMSGNALFVAGSDVLYLLRPYKKAASNYDVLKAIRITYEAELVDQYNNNIGIKQLLVLRFDMKEALRYNLDNSFPFDMINTATIELIHPIAAKVPVEYCQSNGNYSRIFCRKY
jgi:hypothetical protein